MTFENKMSPCTRILQNELSVFDLSSQTTFEIEIPLDHNVKPWPLDPLQPGNAKERRLTEATAFLASVATLCQALILFRPSG